MTIDKWIKFAAVVAALGCSTSAASAGFAIDLFEAGNFAITGGNTGASTTVSGIPTGLTLGGRRDVIVFSFPNRATVSLNAVNPGADDDALRLSSLQPNGTTLTLDYGLGGDLNADFLDAPGVDARQDRVRINFGAGSFPGSFVTTTLISGTGGRTSVSRTFGGGDANLDFLFTDFLAFNPAFGAAGLRDIDQVRVQLSNNNFVGSTVIESITLQSPAPAAVPVPAPAGLFLLGIGLVTAVGYSRRHGEQRKGGGKRDAASPPPGRTRD